MWSLMMSCRQVSSLELMILSVLVVLPSLLYSFIILSLPRSQWQMRRP
jgi:hypothetical protein